MAATEQVILVNEFDEAIGQMGKFEAHEKGLLHRAFSVFVFNGKGELLLQQRAKHKYHSAGLWSNTCCSHPRLNESCADAANRRLQEEMGIQSSLHFLYAFMYNEPMENGLIEHEFDHVFIGISDDTPMINHEEVASWKYISVEELIKDINQNPDSYTIWFRISMPFILKQIQSKSLLNFSS